MKKLIIGLVATTAIVAPLAFDATPANANVGTSATSTSSSRTGNVDRQWLIKTAGWATHDIKTVDYRMHDGIAVSSALDLLAQDYRYMEEAGTPPRTPAATYHARLRTLASFTDQASNIYDYDPMTGTAKYYVVRQQTGILFRQINRAIGTHLTLPPR